MDQRLFRINGWKLIVVLRMEFMEGLMFFHYAFFSCQETGTAHLPLKINSLCFSQMRFILGLMPYSKVFQKFFNDLTLALWRYLSLQLQERFLMPSNSALHVKEVEIEGWARTCNKDVWRNLYYSTFIDYLYFDDICKEFLNAILKYLKVFVINCK